MRVRGGRQQVIAKIEALGGRSMAGVRERMATVSYTAVVTREDGDWLGDVPVLDGASTYASTLRRLTDNLREVVILAEDLDEDADVDLDLQIQADDPAVQRAVQLRSRRRQVEHELADLRRGTTDAVLDLLDEGYSVRDAAAIVGITSGRASQLLKDRRRLIDA